MHATEQMKMDSTNNLDSGVFVPSISFMIYGGALCDSKHCIEVKAPPPNNKEVAILRCSIVDAVQRQTSNNGVGVGRHNNNSRPIKFSIVGRRTHS